MSHYDSELEVRQVRVRNPAAKQANVKRLLKRLLMAATEETGDRRIVGVFAMTFTVGGNVGLAYALTAEEHKIAGEAVPAGLERALQVVRAASAKTAGSA